MAYKLPPEIKLPDKLYFRIGEVSNITGPPPYVLRFWESEFSQIRPKRTPSGQRIYTKKDVAVIFKVKNLLYDQKYTIAGAKRYLNAQSASVKEAPSSKVLTEIRQELESIREILK
ncbi:MAG: MerR family transcriptional regulator [Desulfobacterales bacterium]